jgi:uncharacterized protein
VSAIVRRFLAGAAALLFAMAAAAQPADPIPVPKLAAHVTDLAGTLSPDARSALESKLTEFEQQKGSQVAVLIVPTLGSETIEEFAGRVTDAWALGRKGADDGVLFAVAMKERRMRIHTGRGVQGTLTDAASKRIVAEIVAPRFRDGDFAGGIDAGVDAILRAIEGEALPAPTRKPPAQKVDTLSSLGNLLVLGFFLVPVVAMVLRSMFGRLLGAGATSGLTGFVAWLFFGSLALALVAGFIAFLFTLMGGAGIGRGARRGGWGGYIPGGGWGGGGGSWGGGGGGFSGGGGSFDGGGASGSW